MAYSTHEDLVKMRPQVVDFTDVDWSEQRTQAENEINELLDVHWYRHAAEAQQIDWRSTPLDITYIETDERLKRASCYGTLVKGFEYAMNQPNAEVDNIAEWREFYAQKFGEGIQAILDAGVNYDWDKSGAVEGEEIAVQVTPRLARG